MVLEVRQLKKNLYIKPWTSRDTWSFFFYFSTWQTNLAIEENGKNTIWISPNIIFGQQDFIKWTTTNVISYWVRCASHENGYMNENINYIHLYTYNQNINIRYLVHLWQQVIPTNLTKWYLLNNQMTLYVILHMTIVYELQFTVWTSIIIHLMKLVKTEIEKFISEFVHHF